ncbi:uncharacterized protein LOC115626775 [Scaptodrosophila lebanonensis]|uniref:Uncharacterized protein LOC115626775 n=1 Tax=Drosophila lebanonensis TaxID=7225 RepID=A0A6J2TPY0_DROLE|nr:uncharacterized protein LOC115626775 [Scaptodrosophila lebanonensis]
MYVHTQYMQADSEPINQSSAKPVINQNVKRLSQIGADAQVKANNNDKAYFLIIKSDHNVSNNISNNINNNINANAQFAGRCDKKNIACALYINDTDRLVLLSQSASE